MEARSYRLIITPRTWTLLAVLVVALLAAAGGAFAADTYVCEDPSVNDGAAAHSGSCSAEIQLPTTYVPNIARVTVMPPGGSVFWTDVEWYAVNNIPAGYTVATSDNVTITVEEAMFGAKLAAQGGQPGSGGGEFDLEDLDTTKLSALFGAGFMLVGLSHAIGIGWKTALVALKRL